MIVSTTNTLEGYNIKKYFEPISVNIVIGTNVFSDLKASFSDIFGGRSNTYENKIQAMYDDAVKQLEVKARKLGANAILGLRMDLGEISGKSLQMFMLSAYATPVSLTSFDDNVQDKAEEEIDGWAVYRKMKASRLRAEQDKKKLFSDKNIEFLADHGSPDIVDIVLSGIEYFNDAELQSELGGEYCNKKIEVLLNYFNNTDWNEVRQIVYGQFYGNGKVDLLNKIAELIINNRQIDYGLCLKMIDSDNDTAAKYGLRLMAYVKPYYSSSDMVIMKNLKEIIVDRFPVKATITTKKKVLSSSEVEVWNCTCGKVNDIDTEYCSNCYKDKYGFYKADTKPEDVLTIVSDRLEVLEEMTRNN